MNLNDKCLLVLRPAEPFHEWATTLIQASERAYRLGTPIQLSLEEMQYDTSCYILPLLSPEKTADYLEKHAADMFGTELSTWCGLRDYWPKINFSNFVSSFQFDFYFDWMNFQQAGIAESKQNLSTITLLIKPTERIKEFLRPLLIEKFQVSAADVEEELNMSIIQNGSTAVITDIDTLDNVEYFLEQHCEEIFTHQLARWGGEDSQAYWPRDLDIRNFKEWFTVEIHTYTYLMLH